MRLLLEGSSIEEVLARVQAEHGEAARIVQAERVRTGGIAGFFARERFEVSIEVDDTPPPRDHADPAHTTPRDHADPAHTTPRDHADPAHTDRPSVTGGALDALIAAAEHQERLEPPRPHRPLSTESAAFAEVLRTLQSHEQATAPAPSATPLFRDHAEVSRSVAVPDLHDHAKEGRGPRPFVPSFRDNVAAAGLPLHLLQLLRPDAGPAELLDVLRTIPCPPRLLARAGYLVAVVGERREALAAGRRIADHLKLDPADVLFAGRADCAASAGVLEQLRVGGIITSTDQAMRTSVVGRIGEVPVVVVIEAGYERHELDWTEQILQALRPDQVIACVDATRKTADTEAWLTAWCKPGLHVDALSVHRAASSADPASVLALDVPVAELDGHDGTATTWLAVLLGRVQPACRLTVAADQPSCAERPRSRPKGRHRASPAVPDLHDHDGVEGVPDLHDHDGVVGRRMGVAAR